MNTRTPAKSGAATWEPVRARMVAEVEASDLGFAELAEAAGVSPMQLARMIEPWGSGRQIYVEDLAGVYAALHPDGTGDFAAWFDPDPGPAA